MAGEQEIQLGRDIDGRTRYLVACDFLWVGDLSKTDPENAYLFEPLVQFNGLYVELGEAKGRLGKELNQLGGVDTRAVDTRAVLQAMENWKESQLAIAFMLGDIKTVKIILGEPEVIELALIARLLRKSESTRETPDLPTRPKDVWGGHEIR